MIMTSKPAEFPAATQATDTHGRAATGPAGPRAPARRAGRPRVDLSLASWWLPLVIGAGVLFWVLALIAVVA